MQRLLLSRECGDSAVGLDDVLSERWATLQADPNRAIKPQFAPAPAAVLDIDSATGSLLLFGTENRDTSRPTAALSLYAYPHRSLHPSAKPPSLLPVVSTPPDNSPFAPHPPVAGRFFPGDPALFVTVDTSPTVTVWDTENFIPAAGVALPDDLGPATCLAISSHDSARKELIAVTPSRASSVTLVDLESGTATHTLVAADARVCDLAWSPANPHLLASVDIHGTLCLFDVRRSGGVACLLRIKSITSRRLPRGDVPVSTQRRTPTRKRQRTNGLLGLGCAWTGRGAWRGSSALGIGVGGTGTQPLTTRAPAAPALQLDLRVRARIQFMPDGGSIVTRRIGRGFATWDVLTGRLVSTFWQSGTDEGRPECEAFEIARDSTHLLAGMSGNLAALDANDGGVVKLSGAHGGAGARADIGLMALHPLEEEVVSATEGGITIWSAPLQPLEDR